MTHPFSDLERDILLKTWREMAPLQRSAAERILRLICRICPELRALFGDDNDANANEKPTTGVRQSNIEQSVKCLQPIIQQSIAEIGKVNSYDFVRHLRPTLSPIAARYWLCVGDSIQNQTWMVLRDCVVQAMTDMYSECQRQPAVTAKSMPVASGARRMSSATNNVTMRAVWYAFAEQLTNAIRCIVTEQQRERRRLQRWHWLIRGRGRVILALLMLIFVLVIALLCYILATHL